MSRNHPEILLLQSEKGGSGKTTVADGTAAALQASGKKVLVIDADDGNSGYIRRCGTGSAVPLEWTMGADALDGWMSKNVSDHDVMMIDCGANLIASGAPINNFLGELIMRTRRANGKVVAFALASTNAPGSDRLVREMRDAYGEFASVRLIRNNQDGSNAFPASLLTLGMSKATFPHLSPGVMAARLSIKAPLIDVLTNPPPNHGLAMALYARALGSFTAEPDLSDLFTPVAATKISGIAESAPKRLTYVVRSLAQATDTALMANHGVYVANRAVRVAVRTNETDASISRAAMELITAEDIYNAIDT